MACLGTQIVKFSAYQSQVLTLGKWFNLAGTFSSFKMSIRFSIPFLLSGLSFISYIYSITLTVLMPEEVSKHHSNASNDTCLLKPVFFRLKSGQTALRTSQKGSEEGNGRCKSEVCSRCHWYGNPSTLFLPFTRTSYRQSYNQAMTFYKAAHWAEHEVRRVRWNS